MPKKKGTRKRPVRRRTRVVDGERSVDRAARPAPEHLPIVGIGASAGGLDAFTRLLRHLPAKTGMGYVVVQHLDPSHDSILPELLGRAATIPVMRAEDGMKVVADHVYVIPPNTTMTMEDGRLRLVERAKTRGPHMPVDQFLRSLAAIHGSGAVGVVLSGSGSDGALGIEAIKAEGGITMAQDTGSARYSSMPESATATGHVDFVLPPEEIAAQLGRIGRHEATRPAREQPATEESSDVDKILALLRARTGVDFRQYRRGTVQRRILRRMLLHRQDTKEEYLAYLRANSAEVDALYEDLLIGVTSFFRDPEVFASLQRTGFPELMKTRPKGSPLRLWVAGCAGGEETYSLAICLLEFLGDRASDTPIQIFATDLSNNSIARARAGLYPQGIEAHVSPDRLRRFFVKEDGNYQIIKHVRDLCVFARQNIARDPPFSQLDLISCRNVLIYLEPSLQQRVFPIFHYALKPNALLMLGNAESAGPASEFFVPLDKAHRIYRRRATQRRPLDVELPPVVGDLGPAAKRHTLVRTPFPLDDVESEADRLLLARYTPAGVVINDQLEIIQFRGNTTAFLEHPPGAASLDLIKLVRPPLVAPLRATIHRAREQGQPARETAVALAEGDASHRVGVEVIPFHAGESRARFFAVVFTEEPGPPAAPAPAVPRRGASKARGRDEPNQLRSLRDELAATKRYLQDVVEEHEAANEELRAANEEIQSSNEELLSTNEELETTKEEIQSANEELSTVNEELANRNHELMSISSDLSNVLATANVPMLIVGSDLRIRRFTPALDRVMRIIPADAGRPLGDVRLRVDVPDLEQQILRASETLEPAQQEVRDEDGHWWSMTIRPYRAVDRRIDGAIMVFNDIDATKRREQLIEEARVFAEGIVDNIHDPLVILDGVFHVQSANQSFYATFRTSPAETQGRSIFELSDGQWSIPPLRARLERVIPENRAFHDFEVDVTIPGFGPRAMSLNAGRVDVGAGRPPLVLLAMKDVTVAKRATERERFLADATTRLAASLDLSQTLDAIAELAVPRLSNYCAIHLVGDDGTLLLARETRADSAAGHGAATPSANDGRASITSPLIVPLVARGATIGTFTLDGAEGRGHQLDLPLAEEFGRRAAVALDNARLFASVVEARRDAESARAVAEKANRAKTQFLAAMSHELRTPLNAILGYAQLLDMEVRGPVTDAQRSDLRRIVQVEQHLAYVIGQLLDFAKIDSGRLTFEMADVRLDDVLSRVGTVILPAAEAKGVGYEYRRGDPAQTVWADRDKLEQIVLNLLSNAVKFTDPGGHVTLDWEATDDDVTISVRDTGRGIPADRLTIIFEPFVQLERGLTRGNEGTGLGLSISRDLARAMGGEVDVTTSLGVGSTFVVRLRRTMPRSSA